MDSDPFDPVSLQIGASTPVAQPARLRRRAHQFVMVPLAWKARLNSARNACTLKVALELQFRHWKTGGRSVILANSAMADIGVHRHSKWRALRELEALGLIKVVRRPRKSPEVIVLSVTDDKGQAT